MNLEKLKDAARKYEQKEDWRRAIDVYLKAIQEFESGHDPNPDLSIYNRLGDLYMKANDPADAVQAYERAADLYAEQGFLNNAVALCGKILRVNPGRIQAYLKLAYLHARKNVVIEAKKNLLEYLERMNAARQLDEAFKAMKSFADQFPGNQEIRLMLSELLRASSRDDEAREELEKLNVDMDFESRGDTQGARKPRERLSRLDSDLPGRKNDLVFLDIGIEVSEPAARPAAPPHRRATVRTPRPTVRMSPASEEPLVADEPDTAAPAGEPLDLEPTSLAAEAAAVEPAPESQMPDDLLRADSGLGEETEAVGGNLDLETTAMEEDLEAGPVERLEGLDIERPPDNVPGVEGLESTAEEGLEGISLDEAFESLEVEHTSLIEEPAPGEAEASAADDLEILIEAELSDGGDAADDPGLAPFGTGLEEMVVEVSPEAEIGPADEGLDDWVLMDQSDADLPTESDDDSEVSEAVAFVDPNTPPQIEALEEQVLDDPENPEPHRRLGEALLSVGQVERGADELDLALMAYENLEDWEHALDVVHELIRLDPGSVRYFQKRVEIAYRMGEKGRLIDAYLELGDALMRSGSMEKALAVYHRVAEHDPHNTRANAAIQALESPEERGLVPPAIPGQEPSQEEGPRAPQPPPEAVEESGYVDLAGLIAEVEPVRDTRMRIEDEEPTGDEEKDFAEMLRQFKRGIEENIEAEDFQSHYDLGVAFKEMGLLDEAIAEFQKALRAPEGRLRTSEALGICFFEKEQFTIAEAILRRATEGQPGSDDEKVALLYWLGRSLEAQNRADEAVAVYRRVMAVDIRFADTGTRVRQIGAGRPA